MRSGWATLLPFLAASAATAIIAGRFRPGAWYAALAKPSWTPPGWLFAPVWSLLYLGMAVAGWLVWRAGGRGAILPLAIWVGQLVSNAVWSWLFFGLHRPPAALADIVVLLVLIVAFAVTARPFSRGAAGLFVPYAVWVLFAASLNAEIVRLNPSGS
ncbi:MAG TPA: TspO/MBR family protein [Thermoanaerobaculia bacterium]|nr:TspO/MBR family protein [Thermoanaerobaculia bacterium]